jgi:hypothetical protein
VRRALTIALLLLVVFAAAVLAGFYVAARLAPERVRLVAEQQLGRVLEGRVTLATLQIARAQTLPWLWLEARGARAVLKDDVTILAGRVRARLDPLSLALGRLGLGDLHLDDVIVMFPPDPDGPSKRDRVDRIVHPIEMTGRFLRSHPCAIPDLAVQSLTLLVTRDGMLEALLERGEGEYRCEGLGREHARATLAADARHGAARMPAAFTLAVSRASAVAHVAFEGAPLAGVLGTLGIELPLAGTVRGTARLASGPNGAELEVSLTGRELRGEVPGPAGAPWLALDLPSPRLAGRLTATAERLSLDRLELAQGKIELDGSGSVALPPVPSAKASLVLALDALDRADAPRVLAQLPEALRERAHALLERVEAGRFPTLRARLGGTLEQLGSGLERSLLEQPGTLRLEGALADATVRVGESDLAQNVDASLAFTGDRLSLDVARGEYHGGPLPGLALRLRGIQNLHSFEELDCRAPQPQPPLAGLPRLREWLSEERSDADERSALAWQHLELELDWVSHPLLLCGIEQVVAHLEPAAEGFSFEVPRAVWAGLPLTLEGGLTRAGSAGEPAQVRVNGSLGPPFEAMSLDPPAAPWLAGRFALAATRLGRWHVRGASGGVAANGARLDLPGTTLRLAPGGEIVGRVGIDLGLADALPFSSEAQLSSVDLMQLWQSADLERGALSGSLYGAAAISGQLRPGLNPLGDAKGLLALHARDGTVQRKIPIMLAIALASDRFNPFGSRDELPYEAIDAVARVEGGDLVFDSLQLHAQTLRMGANGKGDAVEPYQVEGVVGLFFFPGLDSLIESVPILNRVILGRNGNFVGAYFTITGPWGEPEASLIPIQSIATGPAGFITEGLPGFVLGGIRSIQSVILPSEEPAPIAGKGPADS